MEAALSGLRVLEVGGEIAGAYAGALFAGLGAEVIKVESPAGDATRRRGPFPGDLPHPEKSGLFLYLNGGKKGLTLDLASPTGQRLWRRLASSADLVLANLPPAQMKAQGLDYPSLATINPRVILTSITPFGLDGPYRDYKDSEGVQQALCGLMFITGEPHREPLCVGLPLAQYAAGQLAFVASLTAFYHHLTTGEGQQVDVSVLEAAVTIMEHAPVIWSYRERVRRRLGNWGGLAAWGIYPCHDGYVGVITGLGATYERFLEWVGPPLTEPRFKSIAARTEYASEMHAVIIEWLSGRRKEEVYREAQAMGIPFGYVCDSEDLVRSPQLAARGFFEEVDHPLAGRLRYPGAPFVLSETPWRAGRAPLLGEHNAEIYCGEMGLRPKDLVRLRQVGVI